MSVVSTFRHEPAKSLLGKAGDAGAYSWRSEPVVTRLRRFRFDNRTLGRQIDVPISATPAIVDDVGVVVASDDGYVRFLSHDLGTVFWERRLSAAIYSSLVVDPRSSRVIACDQNGLVCAFDLRGKLAWHRTLGHPIFATPAINSPCDSLAIAAFGNKAFGLSLSDGEIRYQAELPPPWYAQLDSPVARRNPYASPAMTRDGATVYCSGSSTVLLAADGREIWSVSVDADIKSSPVVLTEANRVVVADVAGRCHFLALDDGRTLATVALGTKLVASGASSNGIVAVGAASGRVWGLDGATGSIAWTSEFGAPKEYGSMTLTPLGDFVATNEAGNCLCLAFEDGRFLWETSQVMGLPEQGSQMDITPIVDRVGRMYCASYDGSLYQFAFRRLDKDRLL